MKIIDRLREDGIHISFEIFPPKTDAGYDKVIRAAEEMAGLKPEFISVTYGAGGGTSKNTAKIASYIKHDLHVESLAHLTCASSTKDEVRSVIASLKEQGIENILALRGDISEDMVFPSEDRFHYAYQLVEEIRRHGDDIHYNFLYRIREAGITVPVLPGIMPITSARQMKRSCELSGTVFPRRFQAILDRFGDSPKAMEQAGIAYATDQIIDLLANGVKNIHIYSMNRPEVAAAIMHNISEIIQC